MHSLITTVPSLVLATLALVSAAPAPAAVERADTAIPDVPSSASAASEPTSTVAFASDNANGLLWTENSGSTPEAIRGSLGGNILGPQNIPVDLQNADFLAPPTTDAGTVCVISYPRSGLTHGAHVICLTAATRSGRSA